MKPFIGITTYQVEQPNGVYNRVNDFYCEAVRQAGGVPLMIPIIKDLSMAADCLAALDGIIFSGGNEFINPAYYGAPPSKFTLLLDPNRDEWEMALIREAYRQDLPILGICRGHQLLNVSLGGSLYYNIPAEVPEAIGHMAGKTKMYWPYHEAELTPGGALAQIFGTETLPVNSYHSQCVKDLAPGLQVTARTCDGLIEGVVAPQKRFTLGVQWHPEAMTGKSPQMLKLFTALITAAKAGK